MSQVLVYFDSRCIHTNDLMAENPDPAHLTASPVFPVPPTSQPKIEPTVLTHQFPARLRKLGKKVEMYRTQILTDRESVSLATNPTEPPPLAGSPAASSHTRRKFSDATWPGQ